MIENVGRMAGMPVGPLALNDEVALDLGWKICRPRRQTSAWTRWIPGESIAGRVGRETGALWTQERQRIYDYPANGPAAVVSLLELQPTQLDPDRIDISELKHRFLAVQSLRQRAALEEGVITDVREADVGSILAGALRLSPAGRFPTSTWWAPSALSSSARSWKKSMARASRHLSYCST